MTEKELATIERELKEHAWCSNVKVVTGCRRLLAEVRRLQAVTS